MDDGAIRDACALGHAELYPQVVSNGSGAEGEVEALVPRLVPGQRHLPHVVTGEGHHGKRENEHVPPADGIVRAVGGIEYIDQLVPPIERRGCRGGNILGEKVGPADCPEGSARSNPSPWDDGNEPRRIDRRFPRKLMCRYPVASKLDSSLRFRRAFHDSSLLDERTAVLPTP